MLNQQHRSNFNTLAVALNNMNRPLHMAHYFGARTLNEMYIGGALDLKTVHDCNTSCCSMGLAAITEGINVLDGERSKDHSLRVFGCDTSTNHREWRFAFHSRWDDDVSDAVKRCEYLRDHGKAPIAWDNVPRELAHQFMSPSVFKERAEAVKRAFANELQDVDKSAELIMSLGYNFIGTNEFRNMLEGQ